MILFTIYSKSALKRTSFSSFSLQYKTPVLCLQSVGLVQRDKTLIPKELFSFWYQTQGLLEDNVVNHYL